AGSNIRWNYGHCTIPRHLRDIYIDEYGIADLRGRNDEDCVVAMAGITDARHQQALVDAARRDRKLRAGFTIPSTWSRNTPERLRDALAPFRSDGTLPDYPLGSDFTEVEQRLLKALGWLKSRTGSTAGKARTMTAALLSTGARDDEAMARMGLDAPKGPGDRLQARLLRYALSNP